MVVRNVSNVTAVNSRLEDEMSKRKRPEDPAILVAWRVQVHRLEEEVKLLKGALKQRQPLKVVRKMRRRHRQVTLQLQCLYEIRRMGKLVSYGRWTLRHANHPDAPPAVNKYVKCPTCETQFVTSAAPDARQLSLLEVVK